MEKCKVYSHLDKKHYYGYRISEYTIKVDRNKLCDSDMEILTDKNGFRYRRCFSLEYNNFGYFVFTQI